MAMNFRIGGVEVENQQFGRLVVRCDEVVDEGFGHPDERLAIGPIFEPMKRGLRSPGGIGIVVRRLIDGDPQGGIGPERLVIVEILIAHGDGVDPLGEHGLLIMLDAGGVAGGGKSLVECVDQAGSPLDFAEQEDAGIGPDATAGEIGLDISGTESGKTEGIGMTMCRTRMLRSEGG